MSGKLTVFLRGAVCVVLVILLAGCGTIMYPHRVGQRGGNVDMGVVAMDGLCLLLFVLPGVVAFIVDYANGAIYLPGGFGSMELKDMKKISFDADKCTLADIEKTISGEIGREVKISGPGMKMYSFRSYGELKNSIAILTYGKEAVLSCR